MIEQMNLDEHPEKESRLRLATQNFRAPRAQAEGPAAVQQDLAVGGHDIHLLDYVKMLSKRRWTAATAFLLVFVSVTVYTFTQTPIYEAKTRLLIESDEQHVVSFKQVVDEDQTKADYYQTQYNILQSRALARKTLDDLKLWDSPYFSTPAQGTKSTVARWKEGFVGFTTSWMKSSEEKEKEPAAADETAAQSHAIDKFLENLVVAPIRNSRLVDLKYRLPNSVIATNVTNALAKNYIEQNLEYKFLASQEATDWLKDRLAEQRKQVEAAEAKLQTYREQNDAIALDSRQDIVVQKLADLNAAVTRAKTERIEKEMQFRQIQSIQTDKAALDSFPAILSNTYIQQLKSELGAQQRQLSELSEKLGDKHPDLVKARSSLQLTEAKLQGEIAKVVQSVRNQFLAAQAQENSMSAALGQQKGEALSMNRKGIEYGVLQRDAESSRQIYDSLLQRAKETGVSGELKTSNIRVVDRAERPRSPVTPRKSLNLSLAALSGMILAFGLAFFFEYIDSRIKSPDEIKMYLRLPSLGMVPALDPKSWKGTEPIITNGVPPNFAEAFRAVRTNVLFSSAEEGARTLVITSTGPGEGKTTVAANLAVGFAQAGQRVLLIDADMRRPRVHQVFGLNQEPGLSNLMVGNAKASDSVRKTSVPGLWVLASGRIPPNPAELIGSQRFRDFLTSLKEHFDCIIVDTPPIMAVTDAAIAANAANGVVFVIGAEMTTRHAAQTAIEQLEKGRAHFVGAVLNRVELERNAYYYSQYYRREYGQYYQQAVNQK
jgi:succinoglycan biosynthesis transport protein ExoP